MKKLLIIVGQAKAGTTSLCSWLGQHPSFSSGQHKETRFFTDMSKDRWSGPGVSNFRNVITSWEQYRDNFAGSETGQWHVDGSTDYLWRSESPDYISSAAEDIDIKVVCIVRDPVDRAISEYTHSVQIGLENRDFLESLDVEDKRIAKGMHPLFYHRRRSRISEDITRYHELFGDRMKIMPFEALQDPQGALDEICDFTGAPRVALNQFKVKNSSQGRVDSRVYRSHLIKSLSRTPLSSLKDALPGGIKEQVKKIVYRKIEASASAKIGEAEMSAYRAMMKSEIEKCCHNPLIPTQSWWNAYDPHVRGA